MLMFSVLAVNEEILPWICSWLWGKVLLGLHLLDLLVSGVGCWGFLVSRVRFCPWVERILESPPRGPGRRTDTASE